MSDSKKKLKVLLPLLFAIVLIIGIFFGFKLRETYTSSPFKTNKNEHPIDQILQLVNHKYVDSVHAQKLASDAINDILHHLDPHSVYIPPKKLRSVTEDMEGHYRGIGVGYYILQDTIVVSRVIKDGPAEAAHLKIGDRILQADDSTLVGSNITSKRVKKLLQGPNKSIVHLKILRDDSLIQKEVQRGMIPLKSITQAYFIKPGIAYMRINRFSAKTYSEFMDAVVALKQQDSIKRFILDLRDNPGGYVDAAVNIADEFLSDGKLVVYTKGRNYPKKEFKCSKFGELEKVPMAVLVNGYSASASEILSGAIQDWDRGYIIGRETYGKGLVQQQFRLSNGAALRLTVARYYLPSGRLIQRPYKHQRFAYEHDMLKRFKHGELLHKDSIHFKDTTTYYTKKEHRKVYAGDGIMPDIFVPIDTTGLSSDLIKLYHDHTLFRFAHHHYIKHPERFKNLDTPSDLLSAQIFDKHFFNKIQQFAAQSKIQLNPINTDELQLAKLQVKAFIARVLWGNNGYYFILNHRDKEIKTAIKTLEEEPDLKSLSE